MFKWTEEAKKAFNEIKKLLINPPVLKAPTPDRLFRPKSDTLREGVHGTLLQKQGDEWVVIRYHSNRLPKSAKNFSVTELELTGLLVNIHSFMQLLHNRYFEVLVDHKVIKYMIKSKTESPMMRLLLKLSEYTIDLKYQKGSEMHTSDCKVLLLAFRCKGLVFLISFAIVPEVLISLVVHKYICCNFGKCCESVP